jgi:hypothetical protein
LNLNIEIKFEIIVISIERIEIRLLRRISIFCEFFNVPLMNELTIRIKDKIAAKKETCIPIDPTASYGSLSKTLTLDNKPLCLQKKKNHIKMIDSKKVNIVFNPYLLNIIFCLFIVILLYRPSL